MSLYFNEGNEYDPVYFSKLIKCMSKYDDDISIKAQNNAWKSMRKFYKDGGADNDYMNKTDYWGECTPGDLADRCPVGPYLKD